MLIVSQGRPSVPQYTPPAVAQRVASNPLPASSPRAVAAPPAPRIVPKPVAAPAATPAHRAAAPASKPAASAARAKPAPLPSALTGVDQTALKLIMDEIVDKYGGTMVHCLS